MYTITSSHDFYACDRENRLYIIPDRDHHQLFIYNDRSIQLADKNSSSQCTLLSRYRTNYKKWCGRVKKTLSVIQWIYEYVSCVIGFYMYDLFSSKYDRRLRWLPWSLRMLYVYTLRQTFDTIRISVIRDITKILKKSIIMSKIPVYNLYNNTKNLLTNC